MPVIIITIVVIIRRRCAGPRCCCRSLFLFAGMMLRFSASPHFTVVFTKKNTRKKIKNEHLEFLVLDDANITTEIAYNAQQKRNRITRKEEKK